MAELPKPESGELLGHFVERCHRDPEMLRQFPNGHNRRRAAQKIWHEAQPPEEPEVLDETADPATEAADLPERQPQDAPGSMIEDQDDP